MSKNIIVSNEEAFIRKIMNQEQTKEYCFVNKKTVFHCLPSEFDRDYAISHGYKIIDVPEGGGTMTHQIGDIVFGMTTKTMYEDCPFSEIYLRCVADELVSHGISAYVDGNDIMVDGYKVAGASNGRYQHISCGTLSVSMSVNIDDISAISKKEMVKTPKGLSDYNVDPQWVIDGLEIGCRMIAELEGHSYNKFA